MNKIRSSWLVQSLAAIVLSFSSAAMAASSVEVGYFVTGAGGSTKTALYRFIDIDAGSYVLVKEYDNLDWHGIALGPDGYLYAITGRFHDTPKLYKLHPATGNETLVGELSGGYTNGVVDLAFSGDTLYGWGRSNGRWNTISLSDASTVVAAGTGCCNDNVGLGRHPDGTMYLVNGNNLYTVDMTTSATASVASGWEQYGGDDFRSMTFGADGTMYYVRSRGTTSLFKADISNLASVTETAIGGLATGAQGITLGNMSDSDSDGIPDAFEVAWGTNKGLATADGDKDSDGLSNLDEFTAGTDGSVADSDGDGLDDGDEIVVGTDPLSADTDGDTLPDGSERAVGLDPLDGLLGDPVTLWTDDNYDDLYEVRGARSSDGRYHILMNVYDDDNTDYLPHYALLDADGEVLIAPSLIQTSNLGDQPMTPRFLFFGDGTVGIAAREDRYVTYRRVNPAKAPLDGTAVDISVTTDFVTTAEKYLQHSASGAGDAWGYHPGFFQASVTRFGMVWPDNNDGQTLHYALYNSSGSLISDVELFGGQYGSYRSNPHLLVDGDTVHVLFTDDGLTSEDELYYGAFSMVDGSTLVSPVLLTRDDDLPNTHVSANWTGDGKIMVLTSSKEHRMPHHPNYGGGDIYRLVLDVSELAFDGSSGSRSDIVDVEPARINGDSAAWYFVMDTDPNTGGTNVLFNRSSGGSYTYDLVRYETARLYSDGTIGGLQTVARTGHKGDHAYHQTGSVVGDGLVYMDKLNVLFRKVGTPGNIDADPASSKFAPTLSRGSFLFLSDLAVGDMPTEAQDSLPDADFTDGFFSVIVGGLEPGESVRLRLVMPSGVPEYASYYKYDAVNGWYEFPFTDVGNDTIELVLTDGGEGDADGIANGFITDPGGLGELDAPAPPPPPTSNVTASGSGGGCVIGNREQPFDPLFPALMLLAGAWMVRRRLAN